MKIASLVAYLAGLANLAFYLFGKADKIDLFIAVCLITVSLRKVD